MENNAKKPFLKKIFFPAYEKVISLLIRDLQVNFRNTELNQIKNKLNELNSRVILMSDQLDAKNKQIDKMNDAFVILNTLYLDVNYDKELSNSEVVNSSDSLKEIFRAINSLPMDYLSVINYITRISKNNKNLFENKSVCVIGKNEDIFFTELKKRGIKKFLSIEPVSIQDSKNKPSENNFKYKKLRMFPTQLDLYYVKNFDIVLIPDEDMSSLIFQKYSYGLGEKIKDSIFLTLWVVRDSILATRMNQSGRITGENLSVYDDNFFRSKLHSNGFFEVESVYTESKIADNYFDKKISNFSYKYGYRIIKNNLPKIKKSILSKEKNVLKKIYVARKIPLHI